HSPFKLGLVDFDVHSRPPFHHYVSMPRSSRESGLGAMGNAPNRVAGVLDGRTGHHRYTRVQYAFEISPHGSQLAERTEGFKVCAGATTAQPPARIPVLSVQILSRWQRRNSQNCT